MSIVQEYLESLPGTAIKKLYQWPSSCLGIFRTALPPPARDLIHKVLLWRPDPLPMGELALRMRPGTEGPRDLALTALRSLNIITLTTGSNQGSPLVSLTTNFRDQYRRCLLNETDTSWGVYSKEPPPEHVTVEFLDEYSREKWEAILQFVVNSTLRDVQGPRRTVNEVIKVLLKQGRLVQTHEDGGLKITQAGFSFLLQSTRHQVWTILILWLTTAASIPNMDSIDMLGFLFMLAASKPGAAQETSALSEPRRNLLPDLVDFGLVYIDTAAPHQFFPTSLASMLTSSGTAYHPHSSKESGSHLQQRSTNGILLETNFRLYFHTRSPLQIAVLSLFATPITRFADFVTMKITKKSVQDAVDYGITSEQIIQYLETHAHPQMAKDALAKNKSILPPNVIDQIRLWQIDRERLQAISGFMFKEFADEAEYKDCVQYAHETGLLVWKSDEKQEFFVSKHEQLANYLKLRKKAG